MNTEYDNIAEGDHQKFIRQVREAKGEEFVIQFIRDNMESIILHYITCTWGACYNTKFKELIQPYLNDAALLDKILRTEVIKDNGNLTIGKTGAKIYKDLYWELLKCDDYSIKQYLRTEFADKLGLNVLKNLNL
jgi:hypothetical protein